MMGYTHGAGGAFAGAVVGVPFGPEVAAACVGAGFVAGYVPDCDHPQSTGSRLGKWAGLGVGVCLLAMGGAWWAAALVGLVVLAVPFWMRSLSVSCGLPAHRGLTHTWFAAVVWGLLVGGVSAVWLGLVAIPVGVASFAGYGMALWQDWITESSLPWWKWYPGANRERIRSGGPEQVFRWTTGNWPERWVMFPVTVVAAVGAVALGMVV
jgi:hypothetical protein